MADEDYRRLAAACACGSPTKKYSGRGRPPKYCGSCSLLRENIKPRSVPYAKACEQCSVMMPPATESRQKRFCSPSCVGKSQRKQPDRHCEECGTKFWARSGGYQKRASIAPKYCSKACYATALSKRMKGVLRVSLEEKFAKALARREKMKAVRASAKKAKEHERRLRDAARLSVRRVSWERMCPACSVRFSALNGRMNYCGRECAARQTKEQKKANKLVRRALLKAARVETVRAIDVFRRDGWRCYLCGCDTPESLRGKDEPNAPEIEHVIPLSRGGEHSYKNVRCACRTCNNIKGDRTLDEVGGAFVQQGRGSVLVSEAFEA